MVTKYRIIWDSIILIVAIDLLHNNFKMTITLLLHSSNKDIEKIQQIVIFTKTTNMIRQITG